MSQVGTRGVKNSSRSAVTQNKTLDSRSLHVLYIGVRVGPWGRANKNSDKILKGGTER